MELLNDARHQELLDEIRARDVKIADLEAQLEAAYANWPDDTEGYGYGYDDRQDSDPDQTNDWNVDDRLDADHEDADAPNLPSDLAPDYSDPPSDEDEADNDDMEGRCAECRRYMIEALDPSDDSLQKRSRLWDVSFYNKSCGTCGNPSAFCRVAFSTHYRLLSSALTLAEQTLWAALRRHYPEAQRRYYPESFHEICFGRADLSAAFGDTVSEYTTRLGCTTYLSVRGYMDNVIYLRNTVCHKSHCTNELVDTLIQHAQSLAVAVGDAPRAMRLRGLRDELQQALQTSLAEIEALEPLAALPHARPWAVHHQWLFGRILEEYDSGFELIEFHKYPSCARRAALEWRGTAGRPGEVDPKFVDMIHSTENTFRVAGDGKLSYKETLEAYRAQQLAEAQRHWADPLKDEACLAEFFEMAEGGGKTVEGSLFDAPPLVLLGPDAALTDEIGRFSIDAPYPAPIVVVEQEAQLDSDAEAAGKPWEPVMTGW
ncbi:hypothetical protein LTR53_005928 [Teratosphaeriaceae sp. CCFEE 6253]|nr:hypothetical protein LTR53_005928 [Teratosphaeriaceae sp. CCFEE 6253]